MLPRLSRPRRNSENPCTKSTARPIPDGYRHASFGNYLMRYRMVTHVVGHVEHYAGDQMYIDFAGDKLEVVDSESGDVAALKCRGHTSVQPLYLFVSVWSSQTGLISV
ncbi:hypothetical protein BACUNI_00034 [Bacteroides uniformis ATCC 8492]|uniref:Uncharacterized protein n=1 Tax=Bacteroides uniformis (strain ATCC 8492 / DSM 6597 / CCUG 4942 / CIP 103695 / JCM 5828 / KCTC 5204 / NCTC 13054 / VPI 0061) TaxID=411479 RepID=A0ABC9NHN3_BACUC|nr:hypothetical protein [Bacteroides uniformis]EDO56295.1 hypothetical protein BACUNI_00034 [Bacteroides uniformis ATCC 8492]